MKEKKIARYIYHRPYNCCACIVVMADNTLDQVMKINHGRERNKEIKKIRETGCRGKLGLIRPIMASNRTTKIHVAQI